MTINEAQQEIDVWIKKYGGGYFSELTNLGMLSEEVGEMAHWIIRKYGDQSLKPSEKEVNIDEAIVDEMTDTLWVLLCMANQMGIDLEKGLLNNFNKKTLRDAERHKKR
ncbi:MAG: nucleotide pyrophosphohydrolase [Saprospiraceae bacterium]|uniref:Nucleotide pyrophosphohydrolase n=1 Tax=Candidatus Opimibacter skivensis TaxID=2982028 RepID=A0A9D7SVY0_9BACT|nr:nucleotide pyrophosphohydrolase [Candidatus Opimibacter skivensis]